MFKSPIFFCVLLGCLLSPIAIFAQSTSLNGTWAFRTDPNGRGEAEGWFNADHPTAGWDSLPVPGNWDLRNEYAQYAGKGWYRRNLTVPADAKGRVLRLCFGAVYHDCTVWLNGRKLGENHSGFLPFAFDVTALINDDGTNTLVVCADNTFRRGAIWNWGGIRRPVTLEATGTVRLVRQHIAPTVDLTNRTAMVNVTVFLQNHGSQAATARGEVQVSAKNGVRKSIPFTAELPANSTQSVVVETNFSGPETHLWHPDDPFLYESVVRLSDPSGLTPGPSPREKGAVASVFPPLSLGEGPGVKLVNRFGLRKIEVDNKNYAFKLNGEAIRPMGANFVPDDRTTGNTLPLWRIKEDVDNLKELGVNMARLSHLPLPEDMLDYLDERGILVISEIPLWGYDPLADKNSVLSKDWLDRLITNQFNHPCIVAWSVGNEIGDYPGALEYVQSATAYVRQRDPSRLAVMVSHTASRNEKDPIQFSDLGLINSYGKDIGQTADAIHRQYPDKVLFYSEYGYGQLQENRDADVDAKAMVDSIRDRPYLIGGSLWTYNDYRSSYVGTKEYSQNRPWGVVDVFRQKKKAWHSFRREMAPIRALTVDGPPASTGTLTTGVVNVVPRRVLDLPAYPLNGYRLLWKVLDQTGQFVRGGFVPLPGIKPGDNPLKQAVAWGDLAGLGAVELVLLSPLAYAVYDTTLFFAKPQVPVLFGAEGVRTMMNGTRPNSGGLHVTFRPTPTATAYKIRYGRASAGTSGRALTDETLPTLNPFAEVTGLPFGDTYRVGVVAINGAGESSPTTIQTVRIEPKAVAPPTIQHVEAADRGFFVGYATAVDDYLFQVQYTNRPGDYANAPTLQSTTRGVLFVPGLTNGQPYFFRLRRLKDNNYASNWSAERTVTPDGGQRPAVPRMQGVVRQATEAVLCFEPVAKATGYVLQYRLANPSKTPDRSSGEWTSVPVSTARSGYFILSGLEKTKPYQFRLSALNANGPSEFSPLINAQRHAEGRRNR